MGKAAIREMEIRQGLVLGLLLLASCQGFRPAEQEVVQLGDELGASMANSTNATAKTEAPKPPEPKSAKEGELMSYMKTVREVMRLKGHDPSDDEIKLLAGHLMEIDETAKDTPKMRAIAEKLRSEGPKKFRVEVDPQRFKDASAERMKREKAKQDEENRQAEAAKELSEKKAKDEQIAVETMKRYQSQVMNPVLEKKLQEAKAEFAQAVSTEKKLKNIPDEKTAKEYGLHDEDSWGPPKAAAKPAAAKPAAAKPSA